MKPFSRTSRSISGASFLPSPVGPPTIDFCAFGFVVVESQVLPHRSHRQQCASAVQGQVDRPSRMALRTRWALRRHRQAQLGINGRALCQQHADLAENQCERVQARAITRAETVIAMRQIVEFTVLRGTAGVASSTASLREFFAIVGRRQVADRGTARLCVRGSIDAT